MNQLTGENQITRVRDVVDDVMDEVGESCVALVREVYWDGRKERDALEGRFDAGDGWVEMTEEFERLDRELDDALLLRYRRVDGGVFWEVLQVGLVLQDVVPICDNGEPIPISYSLQSDILDAIEEVFEAEEDFFGKEWKNENFT